MNQIQEVIVALFQSRTNLQTIGLGEDYFDWGVSSLTVIGLQIEVEQQLGVKIETSRLMKFSTINHWIEAYAKATAASDSVVTQLETVRCPS